MIQSQPYSIPRSILSRITAIYYLRTFWFILIGPFLFGLTLLFVAPNPTIRFFGVILAVWPATVFTRSFLLVGKNAKVWANPTVATIRDDGVYFVAEGTAPTRLRLTFQGLRNAFPLAGYFILQTRRFGFVPIPLQSISEAFTAAIRKQIGSGEQMRRGASPHEHGPSNPDSPV